MLVDQTRDISATFSRRFYERKQDGAVVATGEVILPSYQYSYDFSSFLVPLPLAFPPIDDTFDIFAELFVGTYSSGEDLNREPLNFSSAARMASDQSAFLAFSAGIITYCPVALRVALSAS